MRARSFVAVLAAALTTGMLSTACAGARAEGRSAAAAGPRHVEVDAGAETCAQCHAQATPKAAAEWQQGKHGLALVGCVVCHGPTTAGFRARPDTAACASCHPAQAASAQGGGCFGCHAAHALRPAPGSTSPHRAAKS